MYEIGFDTETRTVRLRLNGFWTVATMNGFASAFLAQLARAGRDGPFVILSDCRAYPVQSAEVSAGWTSLLGRDSRVTHPYAVVVGSALNKLQAERALGAPGLRVFADMDEACSWLDTQRLPPA